MRLFFSKVRLNIQNSVLLRNGSSRKVVLVNHLTNQNVYFSLWTKGSRVSGITTKTTASNNANYYAHHGKNYSMRNKSFLMYTAAVLIFGVGVTYASVPLYRMFCQTTGFGGTLMAGSSKFNSDRLVPAQNSRKIKVTFNADTSKTLQWSFTPQQQEVRVLPGETALAFYTAKNKSNQDLIGIATYNVTPFKVAPYFNKIQCFCFEEQKLEAGEEVDMPVFFFIDPEFADDPLMKDVDTVTLSYTFFKAKYSDNGVLVPVPA
ncbi:7421_t:CDS:2 [Acaulospora morrowiae]|uniref:7421_t:CDS:1 n=1 Tax=Acaulospora morrowiae TaxID=94023 RepID=A0A9N9IF84_9GLOM|nr:7421_t:CDS:2 [Acaulospora morrowiae]